MKRIEYSSIGKVRCHVIESNEDGWKAYLVTPYGIVMMEASTTQVKYETVCLHLYTMIEQGITRTPTGAARVGHKWARKLVRGQFSGEYGRPVDGGIETIDFMEAKLGPEGFQAYCIGSILYLDRLLATQVES